MVIFGNAKVAVAGLLLSLGIFLILYFTVIKPSSDNANDAVKQGERQTQQLLNNASKQSSAAQKQIKSAGVKVPSTKKVDATVDKAKALANCLVTAGTDVTKVQACQAKFGS